MEAFNRKELHYGWQMGWRLGRRLGWWLVWRLVWIPGPAIQLPVLSMRWLWLWMRWLRLSQSPLLLMRL